MSAICVEHAVDGCLCAKELVLDCKSLRCTNDVGKPESCNAWLRLCVLRYPSLQTRYPSIYLCHKISNLSKFWWAQGHICHAGPGYLLQRISEAVQQQSQHHLQNCILQRTSGVALGVAASITASCLICTHQHNVATDVRLVSPNYTNLRVSI